MRAAVPALAAALGLLACAQLRSIPGGRELEQYARREAQRTGQQVCGNLVRMVQSGRRKKQQDPTCVSDGPASP